MKVYITKYALTEGILEVDAEIDGTMAKYRNGAFPVCAHGEGREWHLLEKSALTKTEELRQRKIASYTKAIDKLKKMTFKVKKYDFNKAR
jgi:Leu/Phe-tRNA-protein transferase